MLHINQTLDKLRADIAAAAQSCGRLTNAVTLLAVSKRQPVGVMRDAHAAGQRHFGENYVQEAIDKREHLADLDIIWHFIGPIQSNKTRDIANAFDWVHSVDRDKIAERLSAQRDPALPALNVCVQVNLSDEDSKSGVALADAAQLCALVARLPNLSLRGLMAIPAALEGAAEQRACFAPLKQEFDRLRVTLPTIDTLSIGMSGDYGAAIAEGSTMVRIGTALFGARSS
ncbi:YggS family pyridoxal phosphate-dependent enzyme [Gammaproteobacteria bacterium]|nr:YggS family pyridoxal phosphate-dependent enzyme [Gammaproteobacteria bacterium]MDB9758990.1 YggS family pyridoxal phosphate-dependent enzyme [Gammaproteobacteria bacterium]MDC1422212.1 YggS family pyridoxal phosphate-dependent enzyme [Gammaproteobacteria bacterium]MDC1511174.1 YggS family pyridoxal phosphate-dependent enzyme [Gammaproteobacteria bacterium]